MTCALLLLLSQEPWEFRVETDVWRTTPKFRIRDGEKDLRGGNVHARDIDGDEPQWAGAAALVLRWRDEIFRTEFWGLDVEGDGVLPQDTAWGGAIFPAGTPTDYDIQHRHYEIGYRHRFHPAREVFRIDLGLDVQYLTFDARMGFGRTQLRGFYWTPEADFTVTPLDGLELWAHLGGLEVATVKSKMAVLEPFEVGAGLRFLLGPVELEGGWTMVHVHLEENMGDVKEDIVHLRLRSWQLGLNLKF